MDILIYNGILVNPAHNICEPYDLLIQNGIIRTIGKNLHPSEDVTRINANQGYIFPGFIDLHVHLRDPGQTHKEDIETGSKAAAKGGFTTVCAMPNTSPVTDSTKTIQYILERAKTVGLTRVLPVASITKGMEGHELSPIRALIKAGAAALSEDGKSVMNAALLKEAMEIAAELNIPILSHCEDKNLVKNGVIHAGKKAKEFGLPGIGNDVENTIAARDMILAKETGCRLHLCHCSTKETVSYLRKAKQEQLPITGECCPHHFTLCEDDITDAFAAEYKMNPPLRTKEDQNMLRKGLLDGTIDVIATDHAPHTIEEKAGGFLKAPFGIVGLETAATLTYTELVQKEGLSVLDMARRLSLAPARVLGLDRGDLSEGKAADITIFHPQIQYQIKEADFVGKSHNMPYEGRTVWGKVCTTIFDGRIVYQSPQA